jgi:hypothetical protein
MPEPSPSFLLQCPACRGSHLNIVVLTWVGSIPLGEDGFAFDDAHLSSTEDEVVECQTCQHRFPLSAITL